MLLPEEDYTFDKTRQGSIAWVYIQRQELMRHELHGVHTNCTIKFLSGLYFSHPNFLSPIYCINLSFSIICIGGKSEFYINNDYLKSGSCYLVIFIVS